MMNSEQDNRDKDTARGCLDLVRNCRTMILSTRKSTQSHASYAPFSCYQGRLYVLVSALAEHTANLQDNRQAGCMLIEDESSASQILARRRLMFKSRVLEITRTDVRWPQVIGRFRSRFGEILDLLESLPDFTVFELEQQNLILVRGFGDAHEISAAQFRQVMLENEV